MISKTTEYALRAAVWLAAHPDRAYTTREIAAETRVPRDYLAKVLKDLGRTGLVRAQPGRGGGFTLSRPAAEVAVLEVTNAVEPIRRIRECPLGLKEHAHRLCPLHYRLDSLVALMEDAFRNCTVAELLAEFHDHRRLSPWPIGRTNGAAAPAARRASRSRGQPRRSGVPRNRQ